MKIALLGCGVVGGGVLEIAQKRSDMSVKYVLVRRDKPELGDKAVKDINVILNDKEVDTVVEVMGGLSPAFEYVAAAMRAGKNVVTANKHLVAHYYKELVSLASEMNVAFRCTPAVGGGIPWLVNLERVKRLVLRHYERNDELHLRRDAHKRCGLFRGARRGAEARLCRGRPLGGY